MKPIFRLQNLPPFVAKFFSEFLLGVYAGIYQRALVDESGMMRTQMEMHNRSENACSASDSLYDATP
jgi:uncharacterized membrane protein (DUF106 family)